MTTAINEARRYHRQELIEGWQQDKLSGATVTIVGSDLLAQYCALPLAALGIGKLRIIDTARSHGEAFLDTELGERGKGMQRAHSLEQKLCLVNPSISVQGVASSLVGTASQYFLEDSNVIIDATNDPHSKSIAYEYSIQTGTPLFSVAGNQEYGTLRFEAHRPAQDRVREGATVAADPRILLHHFQHQEQDELISMLLGGVIAEEVKKILMQEKELLSIPLHYAPFAPDRFSEPNLEDTAARMLGTREMGEFGDKKVLMIGAGALGNFVALGLAKLGIGRIDLIDPDTVEETNLNRQVLFYDCVGKEKAKALAAKVRSISHGLINASGLVDRFTEKSDFRTNYDLIFDCVDNFTVRAVINDYALAHTIPLISGGTDFQAGQVAVYVPGKTFCMDCQLNIHELGVKAEERRKKIGCLEQPNPSVIMTNQVIGALMVNEARTVLNAQNYGEPVNGNLKYVARLDSRLGHNPIIGHCQCTPKRGFTIRDPRDVNGTDTAENEKDTKEGAIEGVLKKIGRIFAKD